MRSNIKSGKPAQCINCGKICAPQKLDKAYLFIAGILSLFYVIPGILYLYFAKGHIFKCEHCGAKLYTQWN